jgi:hypothetical protein
MSKFIELLGAIYNTDSISSIVKTKDEDTFNIVIKLKDTGSFEIMARYNTEEERDDAFQVKIKEVLDGKERLI